MDNNLFANIDKDIQKEEKSNYYDDVLEKRKRPNIQEEDKNIQIEEQKVINKEKQETKELKKYTHKEVREAATEYFDGDTLAANVWIN